MDNNVEQKLCVVLHWPHYSTDGSYRLNDYFLVLLMFDKTDNSTMLDLSLAELIPDFKSLNEYFRYDGSLTTPSCAEAVVWTVFEHTIPLSRNQVWGSFADVTSTYTHFYQCKHCLILIFGFEKWSTTRFQINFKMLKFIKIKNV